MSKLETSFSTRYDFYLQDATKSGRFDEVVYSKTLDFFTFVNGDGEPRITLQYQAELQGLQYLEEFI